jgi:hypothetical protein
VQTILEIFMTASTFHKTNESIHTPTVYQCWICEVFLSKMLKIW